MSSRVLAWFLPISAVLLVAVTVFEQQRAKNSPAGQQVIRRLPFVPVGPELRFELSDSANRPVRLARYLGRHPILLAFLAEQDRIEQDQLLRRLREVHPAMKRKGIIVLAITQALPQEARQAFRRGGSVPFPVLSDVGASAHSAKGKRVATAWGLGRDDNALSTTVAFLIDRGGRVAWNGSVPEPLEHPQALLDEYEELR
jgi:peroxiredoxin